LSAELVGVATALSSGHKKGFVILAKFSYWLFLTKFVELEEPYFGSLTTA
jgi:hypothetical protein